MNDPIDIGVAGFRIESAKYISPADLDHTYNDELDNLNTDYFSSGAVPFVYQEVVDFGNSTITKYEYNYIVYVTELRGRNFKYNSWKTNEYLDWYGAESNQGEYNGVPADGSPMVWTTDDPDHPTSVARDGYGYEHIWCALLDVKCRYGLFSK
ncbi:alpha-amylase-like [Saccoglossus kowalevskii]